MQSEEAQRELEGSPVHSGGISAATRFILGPDYESECPKCDGSECDGTCGVADMGDFDEFEQAIAEAATWNAEWEIRQKRVAQAQDSPDRSEVGDTSGRWSGSAAPPTVSGGCISISNEPNTPYEAFADSSIPMPRFIPDQALLMYEEDGQFEDDYAMNAQWEDMDIDVILDSGCSDHVMNIELDAPGYALRPSKASEQGRAFIVGNGERVPNEGEAALNLRALDGQGVPMDFVSVFQSAKVTKPLMSVAKICQNGYVCQFTDDKAVVLDKRGETVCTFRKERDLYVSRLRLRAPARFRGQA